MTKLASIKQKLQLNKGELSKIYGISEIGIFGSFIHGKQTRASDVDLLVDFDRKIGLFAFVHLKNHLTDMLNMKVDLVMKRALKPHIGRRILREVEYI